MRFFDSGPRRARRAPQCQNETSGRYSLVTVRTVNAADLVSRLRSLVRRGAKRPKWLVVADVNLYVRALVGNPEGPDRKIIEAAITGVIVLIISEQIRRETIEVLSRPEISNVGDDQAADLMDSICRAARFVEPVADDPRYVKVVHDPDDAIILRTAAGIFLEPDLALMPDLYIVSGDKHAFPPGENWYSFKYRQAHEFWRELANETNDTT